MVGVVGVGLAQVVGLEERRPAGAQMLERRGERRAQVRLGREVADRVVGEDRVERAPVEAERAHAASMCSHSGLIERLSASISEERSVSVRVACAVMCEALFPPPEPSSRIVASGSPIASVSAAIAWTAPGSYSSGAVSRWNQGARSVYRCGCSSVMHQAHARDAYANHAHHR